MGIAVGIASIVLGSAVAQAQKSGGTLVILGDQHAGPKGCWVDFFGRPASSHKAVAVFCLAHNAPMVVTYARRRENRPMQFELGIAGVYDPLTDGDKSVSQLTQWYSDRLEEVIREAPEQYWWLHRRWKEPPKRRRRSRKDAPASERPTAPHVSQNPSSVTNE